jgi:indole-3-glycerol phosphate synthase
MILDDIVAFKKLQIEEEKRGGAIYLENFDRAGIRDFRSALEKQGISIIAEIKKASPSKGIIAEDFDVPGIAELYEKINIDAVSVLTEKQFFKGDDRYLGEVRKVCKRPILRKDFIIDEYQIVQSKVLGADAILLIEEVLGDKLARFYKLAKEIGLNCLTEVHSERALYGALSAGCDIIGINNRDLRDFSVDLGTTERLMKLIPENIIVVSESGIKTPEDIRYLSSLGANGVLIGETFMKNIHEIDKVRSFVDAAKGD